MQGSGYCSRSLQIITDPDPGGPNLTDPTIKDSEHQCSGSIFTELDPALLNESGTRFTRESGSLFRFQMTKYVCLVTKAFVKRDGNPKIQMNVN
jgi:hypothetical protein